MSVNVPGLQFMLDEDKRNGLVDGKFTLERVVNDKTYDSRTLTLGAALPAFAVAIPGSIGAAFLWLIGACATFVSWLMSLAF